MPDFDLDSAFAQDAPKRWNAKIQRSPSNGVAGCWLYYCADPDLGNTVLAHDFKNTVDTWRRNRVDAPTVRDKILRLLAYLNRLSAENPTKPFHPDYEHLCVWTWVHEVGGDLDDPSIASL